MVRIPCQISVFLLSSSVVVSHFLLTFTKIFCFVICNIIFYFVPNQPNPTSNITFFKNTQPELSWWLCGRETTCQCRRQEFSPLIREDPTCCRAAVSVSQLQSLCSRACAVKITRGATAVRNLSTASRGQPCSSLLEKNPCRNEDPADSKINKNLKKNTQLSVREDRSCPLNSS